MTDPTTSPEEGAVILEEVKQRLRDRLEQAMTHEFDGVLGTPEAIRKMPTSAIDSQMRQLVIRLQAYGFDHLDMPGS